MQVPQQCRSPTCDPFALESGCHSCLAPSSPPSNFLTFRCRYSANPRTFPARLPLFSWKKETFTSLKGTCHMLTGAMTSMSQSGSRPGALESLIHQSDDVGELLRADDSLLRQQFFSILKEHHPQVKALMMLGSMPLSRNRACFMPQYIVWL